MADERPGARMARLLAGLPANTSAPVQGGMTPWGQPPQMQPPMAAPPPQVTALDFLPAFNGLKNETEGNYKTFMAFDPKVRNWRNAFANRYGEQPRTEGGDYDYRAAYENGSRPQPVPGDTVPHWSSVGKSADHPTMWKQNFMTKFGVDPDTQGLQYTPEMQQFMQGSLPQFQIPGMPKGGMGGEAALPPMGAPRPMPAPQAAPPQMPPMPMAQGGAEGFAGPEPAPGSMPAPYDANTDPRYLPEHWRGAFNTRWTV